MPTTSAAATATTRRPLTRLSGLVGILCGGRGLSGVLMLLGSRILMVDSVMGARPVIGLASTFGTAGGIGTARRGGRAGSSATSGPASRSVFALAADLGSQVVEDVAGGALLRVYSLLSRLAGLGLLLGLGQGSVNVGEIRFCLRLRDASVRGTTATGTASWRGLLGRGSPGIGGARGVGAGLGRTGISLLDGSVLVSRSRTGLLVRSRGGTRSAASSRRTRQVVCLGGRGGLTARPGGDVFLSVG